MREGTENEISVAHMGDSGWKKDPAVLLSHSLVAAEEQGRFQK